MSGYALSDIDPVFWEGKHLVVSCTLSFQDRQIPTYALLDTGATGIAFIDEDFVNYHDIPLAPLKQPRQLEVIDGRPISSGNITHMAVTQMSIHDHSETLPMFVTRLGHYPVVLGIPWMDMHDVNLRFSARSVSFGSQYCLNHCLSRVTTVQAISSDLPEKPVPSICLIGAPAYLRLAKKSKKQKTGRPLWKKHLQKIMT